MLQYPSNNVIDLVLSEYSRYVLLPLHCYGCVRLVRTVKNIAVAAYCYCLTTHAQLRKSGEVIRAKGDAANTDFKPAYELVLVVSSWLASGASASIRLRLERRSSLGWKVLCASQSFTHHGLSVSSRYLHS